MKKAFTMLELVFVIVIIGILSTFISPNFQRDTLTEAANQIVSHIRYTQHLAMMDNKFDATDASWFRRRWQIHFGKSNNTDQEYAYSIYSDAGAFSGSPGQAELAKNPMNSKQFLTGGYSGVLAWDNPKSMKKLNLGKTYGVKDVIFTGGCSLAKRVAFDHLGRPIIGDISATLKPMKPYMIESVSGTLESGEPMHSRCAIELCETRPCGQVKKVIAIEPETGYTHIL